MSGKILGGDTRHIGIPRRPVTTCARNGDELLFCFVFFSACRDVPELPPLPPPATGPPNLRPVLSATTIPATQPTGTAYRACGYVDDADAFRPVAGLVFMTAVGQSATRLRRHLTRSRSGALPGAHYHQPALGRAATDVHARRRGHAVRSVPLA